MKSRARKAAAVPADAKPQHWVYRLPAPVLPFAQLARADRPIGMWLLLLPCWWSLTLASASGELAGASVAEWRLYLLFLVGAWSMRSAGCVLNDIVDRNLDARVARTAARPLAARRVAVRQAVVFLGLLLAVGLAVLLQFNRFTIGLGFASLPLVALYPWVKRVSHFPQAVLGLTFSWGALMGWAALTGGLAAPPLLLYAASFFWIVGYDTIYAAQDRDDDRKAGIGSTALAFGKRLPLAVGICYAIALAGFAASGAAAGLGLWFWASLPLAAAHSAWQVVRLVRDRTPPYLRLFQSNALFGALLLAAIWLGGF